MEGISDNISVLDWAVSVEAGGESAHMSSSAAAACSGCGEVCSGVVILVCFESGDDVGDAGEACLSAIADDMDASVSQRKG